MVILELSGKIIQFKCFIGFDTFIHFMEALMLKLWQITTYVGFIFRSKILLGKCVI